MEEKKVQQNKIYKLLPIFEGKIKGETKLLSEQETYNRFYAYLGKLLIELDGWYKDEADKPLYFNEIIRIMRGMSIVPTSELTHANVKSCVMHCLNLIK